MRSQLDEVARWPHDAVKLKVGRPGSLAEEIALVRDLRAAMRPQQSLRLDANRRWTRAEALRFARGVLDCELEYVEEPTEDPNDFECLHGETGIRYAMDESLRESSRMAWDAFPHVSALIVKPTLMGSIDRIRELATHGIPLVFSASFESSVGLLRIAFLASQLAPQTCAGLDTSRWLAQDVVAEPLRIGAGQLELDWKPEVETRQMIEVTA